MTAFLQLCKDTRRECRMAGSGPTSVLNNTGDMERLVNWVAESWDEIQNEEPNWRWMRSEFSLQTVASLDTYAYSHANMTDSIAAAAITRFGRWWTEELQIYLTSAGIATRHPIGFARWDLFRQLWLTGSQNPGYPSYVSIDPRDKLRLGAPPNDIYTVTGEYQKSVQVLAADTDVPEMPPQFHRLIVKRAMKKYASAKAAPEIWAQADAGQNELELALAVSQKPPPRLGNPLC